jgi:sulfate transport system permease protein
MSAATRPAAADPTWLRWAVVTLTLLLAAVIFLLPLAAVFTEALRRGWEPALAAIAEETRWPPSA